MRAAMDVVLQALAAFLLAGAILPLALWQVPALRDDVIGRIALFGTPVVLFIVLRLIWPSRVR